MSSPGPEVSRRDRVGVRLSATMAATAVVAVVFALSGLLFVQLIERSLVRNLDSTALARARDVATLASTHALRDTIASTGEDSALVQVVGPTGTVLSASENIQGEPATLTSPPTRRRVSALTRSGLPIGGEGGQFRVVALPVTLPDGPGWVYVATSLGQVDEAVQRLAQVLLFGLPALLVVVTAVIWTAVGRALRPVERMRRRAAAIGGDDLQERVPVPRSRDEIARLAVTLNEMLARLQASALRQHRFVGDASHELKSPLTALRAQVDVALAYPEGSDSTQVLSQVQHQAGRMEQLIDDLLFLARADEGGHSASTQRVDLDELVLAEAHRLRGHRHVTITLRGPEAAAVAGSERDLTRMLRNLGDNALAHARSQVSISLFRAGEDAVITVIDDGPGIPPQERERIFERFTRLEDDRSRHTAGGGTGLGLAITREIARAHGGNVTAQGRPDGRTGAAFEVRLPVSRGGASHKT